MFLIFYFLKTLKLPYRRDKTAGSSYWLFSWQTLVYFQVATLLLKYNWVLTISYFETIPVYQKFKKSSKYTRVCQLTKQLRNCVSSRCIKENIKIPVIILIERITLSFGLSFWVNTKQYSKTKSFSNQDSRR